MLSNWHVLDEYKLRTKSLLLSSSTNVDSVTSRLKNNWELFPLHIWKQHQQYLMTGSYCLRFNCYVLRYFHALFVHITFSLGSQRFLTYCVNFFTKFWAHLQKNKTKQNKKIKPTNKNQNRKPKPTSQVFLLPKLECKEGSCTPSLFQSHRSG